jgi:hypothetical protein
MGPIEWMATPYYEGDGKICSRALLPQAGATEFAIDSVTRDGEFLGGKDDVAFTSTVRFHNHSAAALLEIGLARSIADRLAVGLGCHDGQNVRRQ